MTHVFKAVRTGRAAAAFALLVLAAAPAAAVPPVNADRHGVAVHGYDVVAYFKEGRPARGKPEFSSSWRGATFLFASAEHRDLFAKAPGTYAPRYGGYCAKAVSENQTADVDPAAAWKIVDGRLYLNYNARVQKLWEEDIPGRIARADANWPGLSGLKEQEPAASPASDPLTAYPENYTVLFENDQVRVLDFRLRKGDKEEAHAHPAHVAVFMADFRIRFTLPGGKTAIRDAKAGTTAYSGATVHASENIGTTDAHGILVELKSPAAMASR